MTRLTITAVNGLPEIRPGDDLAALISDAVLAQRDAIRDGDIVVIAQKIVSKSEGRIVRLAGRGARRARAKRWRRSPARTRARSRSCSRSARRSCAGSAASSSARRVTASSARTRASIAPTRARRTPSCSFRWIRTRRRRGCAMRSATRGRDRLGRRDRHVRPGLARGSHQRRDRARGSARAQALRRVSAIPRATSFA